MQIDSGFNSRSSPTATRNRRPPVRLTDELNINYVDDYLSHNHGNNPVPLAMLGVVGEGGRVSGRQSQLFSNNPLYNHINLSQQLWNLCLDCTTTFTYRRILHWLLTFDIIFDEKNVGN